jgi:hypothetical protein
MAFFVMPAKSKATRRLNTWPSLPQTTSPVTASPTFSGMAVLPYCNCNLF